MIKETDLRIDVYRTAASWEIPTNKVAVRVTHLPSGLSGTCEHEGSTFVARDVALTILVKKLRANGYSTTLEMPESPVGRSLADAWTLANREAFPEDEE